MSFAVTDFILEGGDFDFMSKDLVNWLGKKVKKVPKGIWYHSKNGKIMNSGNIFPGQIPSVSILIYLPKHTLKIYQLFSFLLITSLKIK